MKNGIVQIGLMALAAMTIGLAGCNGSGGGDNGSNANGSEGNGGGTPIVSESGNEQSGDTIKIGLIASLNGDLRPWGVDCYEGAKLAVDEVNAAGGIGGMQVELVRQDSNSKPEEGKTAAEKLASDGVLGIIGEVSSGITLQIKEVSVPKGIPLVAVGATNPRVTENSNGLVFRVCYTDDLQGPVMAQFAYEYLAIRKVAVMTDQAQAYSQGLSESFINAFEELGGEIVAHESYESKQNQFGPQITAIKGASPQGIFISGYFNEAGPMARQIRQQGIGKDVHLFGGDGWDSSEIVTSGGDAIVGGFLCNHYNDEDDRAQVRDFLAKWAAADKDTEQPGTTMGALGYDATALMIDALKRCHEAGDDLNSTNLAKHLNETEGFEAVSGTINLKGHNGDPPKRALVVQLEQDGSQSFVIDYEASEVQ